MQEKPGPRVKPDRRDRPVNLATAPSLTDLMQGQGIEFVRAQCLNRACNHHTQIGMEQLVILFGADAKFATMRGSSRFRCSQCGGSTNELELIRRPRQMGRQ
jgi:hypothetical protein